jgi:pantoate--beta-alanine ligase
MPERTGAMKTVRSVAEAAEAAAAARSAGLTVGLVPTMGALHAGHRSLVERARAECGWVAVSVYVNPTQFGEGEDLDRYPRTLDADRAICNAAGADLVFAPTNAEMYCPNHTTWVEVGELTTALCGLSRPGHFRGVTTVVSKLFNVFRPDRAYFGQKDLQQVVVVERMVRDLNFGVTIVRCPIVREPDGLAMSSRNKRLSPHERSAAVVLHEALDVFVAKVNEGERSVDPILEAMSEIIIAEPAAELDYLAIVNADTLEDVRELKGTVAAALAVWMGKTRLIDNVVVTVPRTS